MVGATKKRTHKRKRVVSEDNEVQTEKPTASRISQRARKKQKKTDVISSPQKSSTSEPENVCVPEPDVSDDIFSKILQSKQTFKLPGACEKHKVLKPLSAYSSCILHYFQQQMLGMRAGLKLKKSVSSPLLSLISNMGLLRTASPFDRRCTALEWHPTRPGVLAVGSKGGDILLWDTNNTENDLFITGKGAGGSIQAIKFFPSRPDHVLTASIDGTVTIHDFHGHQDSVLLDTLNCYDFWYCSVDITSKRNLIAAGDNVGNITLTSLEGRKVMCQRLHKQKVTHVEFSPQEDWLLCSASIDHTAKLWDVRMIKDKNSALGVCTHDRGVNSAHFSLTDGMRLLTTDQHHELRVYSAPYWQLEQTISHPHRFFQHITPIKAHWHPLQDIIVVGRYPDEKMPGFQAGELRTIDVFDAETGRLSCQLHDPSVSGLISLNKFNPEGDCLASTMGVNILLWSREEVIKQKQEALMAELKRKGLNISNNTHNQPPRPRSRLPPKQSKNTKLKMEQKTTNAKLKTKNKKA